jgi:hypothetical protein
MKTVMIHHVHDWMLDLDLSKFDLLTFDDGLYSQYKNIKHFAKFNKPMLFFISTGQICQEETFQNEEVISCDRAHELFFDYGDRTNYMKWSQIQEIKEMPNCSIGGHSHSHPYLRNASPEMQAASANYDIIEMMSEFNKHNIVIDSFCFPYNFEAIGWRHYLKKLNVEKFYGAERTPIEDLK